MGLLRLSHQTLFLSTELVTPSSNPAAYDELQVALKP